MIDQGKAYYLVRCSLGELTVVHVGADGDERNGIVLLRREVGTREAEHVVFVTYSGMIEADISDGVRITT